MSGRSSFQLHICTNHTVKLRLQHNITQFTIMVSHHKVRMWVKTFTKIIKKLFYELNEAEAIKWNRLK